MKYHWEKKRISDFHILQNFQFQYYIVVTTLNYSTRLNYDTRYYIQSSTILYQSWNWVDLRWPSPVILKCDQEMCICQELFSRHLNGYGKFHFWALTLIY